MRKVKLELETLAVESFDTATENEEVRGTVRGNQISVAICTLQGTCRFSCIGSCTNGVVYCC